MIHVGRLSIDSKSIWSIIIVVLGWITTNGPTVIPMLPSQWQKDAGDVVMVAGFILAHWAQTPKITTPNGASQ